MTALGAEYPEKYGRGSQFHAAMEAIRAAVSPQPEEAAR